MPFGGVNQLTPVQAMVQKFSLEKGDTDACSFMSWGYNPFVTEQSPYHGAYLAVVESISKLVATGASFEDVYLTFQEYFERLNKDEKRWGKPLAALLGAFEAQLDFGVASIGGKDSMSGTFENLSVPPTLVSFAVTTGKTSDVVTPEFKKAGDKVYLLSPKYTEKGLPDPDDQIALFGRITKLVREGKAVACYTPGYGGVAEAVYKSAIGNGFGFKYEKSLSNADVFGYKYGGFLVESSEEIDGATLVGEITTERTITRGDEKIDLAALDRLYEDRLEGVYACNIKSKVASPETVTFGFDGKRCAPAIKTARPRFLIPVFPGTNCEYDSAKAVERAGAEAEIFVVRNLTADDIRRSAEEFAEKVKRSQVVFIPGGFSGGDEPDGSGKFITAFFRSPDVRAEVTRLLDDRDGLMLGICNGFQALVKLGLVPYGKITEPSEDSPTLTFNEIARHQSRIVRVRVSSNKSPWLALTNEGDVYSVPISHGEGRFVAGSELDSLVKNGQIATQYVDLDGAATSDVRFNPNGSELAIEGITSPDGRVLGKMGHSERIGNGLYKNVVGEYDMKLFLSAVKYFKG